MRWRTAPVPGQAGISRIRWLPVLAVMPLLAGCFDLDRFTEAEEAEFDSAAPETWLFYYDADRLRAIEPGAPLDPEPVGDRAPQSPLTVDGGAAPVALLGGDWEAGPSVERVRVKRVLYADDTGRLFRVSADLGSRPADTRERMSSHSGPRVCGWMPGPDFTDPDAGGVAFLVENGSGCDPEIAGAGNWKGSRIGADGDTLAEDFPGEPLRPLVDGGGRFAGFLAHQVAERRMLRVRSDLRSWEVLRSGVDRVEELAGMPGRAAALIVDGELCVQSAAADEVECRGHHFADAGARPPAYALDGDVLYFVDAGALWRVDLDARGIESVGRIAAPGDAAMADGVFQRVTVTPDHVVWIHPDRDGGSRVRSYERAAAADDYRLHYTVNIGDAPATINPLTLPRSGGWIFYSRIADDGAPQAVARRADDASRVVRHADAWWVGGSRNPLTADPADSFEIAHLLEGVSDGPGGAALRAVSAGEPDGPTVRLGQFDARLGQLEFLPVAPGASRVVAGVVGGRERVYYFDSTVARSLTAVAGDGDQRPVVAVPSGVGH